MSDLTVTVVRTNKRPSLAPRTGGGVRRPTFLYIGADKCGSKTLHKFFESHPDCFVPKIADPYFFDKNYERGHAWYWSLFAGAPAGALAIGEFSHDYIQSDLAAHRIHADLPDAKLIATIRHPIDRALSSYASGKSARIFRGTFEETIEKHPWVVDYGRYASRLATYFDLFGRDRLKVLLFDDLQANPRAFAEQAFAFVGLPACDSINYDQRMSVAWKSRWPLSGPISKLGAKGLRKLGWVGLLGRLKGNPKVRAAFRAPLAAEERPKLDPETRRRLCAEFAPEVDRLEAMLGRDLSAWRT